MRPFLNLLAGAAGVLLSACGWGWADPGVAACEAVLAAWAAGRALRGRA